MATISLHHCQFDSLLCIEDNIDMPEYRKTILPYTSYELEELELKTRKNIKVLHKYIEAMLKEKCAYVSVAMTREYRSHKRDRNPKPYDENRFEDYTFARVDVEIEPLIKMMVEYKSEKHKLVMIIEESIGRSFTLPY